ncbi:regulatory protein RecX [Sediminihaliea albiluteola]|nr:regulatory protein RecX [Sediminihaliea albiluteola]
MPKSRSQDATEGRGQANLSADKPADIRYAAMNLLARREHSRQELREKLGRRFSDQLLIDSELQRLSDENLQSDSRFAESFVRQRALRGYGPLRLRQEMRHKGLSDEQLAQALEALDINWYELAFEVYQKKYGRNAAPDIKEKSKRLRFMQYRGFAMEHLESLFD